MDDWRRNIISPFTRFMRLKDLVSLSGQRIIFPFYHTVSGEPLPHIRHLYQYRNEKEFEQDLEAMLKLYEPISIGQFLKSNGFGKRRCMVLSFDDGLAECHQFIAPLLQKRGVPAQFFINNQFIDNKGLFFRYKASLLTDRILSGRVDLTMIARQLAVQEAEVVNAIQMITYNQQSLLDDIASIAEIDFSEYLKTQPVYMTSDQIEDLVKWGFELGGHSFDHIDFAELKEAEIIHQVKSSLEDLQRRYSMKGNYFSFPFSSDGIPEAVINQMFSEGIVDALFGTSGLKNSKNRSFIQRIPMEKFNFQADKALKIEYLYYLLKMPFGRNKLR